MEKNSYKDLEDRITQAAFANGINGELYEDFGYVRLINLLSKILAECPEFVNRYQELHGEDICLRIGKMLGANEQVSYMRFEQVIGPALTQGTHTLLVGIINAAFCTIQGARSLCYSQKIRVFLHTTDGPDWDLELGYFFLLRENELGAAKRLQNLLIERMCPEGKSVDEFKEELRAAYKQALADEVLDYSLRITRYQEKYDSLKAEYDIVSNIPSENRSSMILRRSANLKDKLSEELGWINLYTDYLNRAKKIQEELFGSEA